MPDFDLNFFSILLNTHTVAVYVISTRSDFA